MDDRGDDQGNPAKWSVDLTFRAAIPFADLNRVMRAFGTIDGQLVTNGLDVQHFLVSAATDACGPVLTELLEDRERAVDITTLGSLTMWLIGLYSDRPTTR